VTTSAGVETESKTEDTVSEAEEEEVEEISEPTVEEQLDAMLEAETGPVETLGAETADWQEKADESEVADLFSSFLDEIVSEPAATTGGTAVGVGQEGASGFAGIEVPEPPPPPPPVDIKVSKMSRDGKIAIDFNQPLKVPNFGGESGNGRKLIGMADLDVSRDIV